MYYYSLYQVLDVTSSANLQRFFANYKTFAIYTISIFFENAI